MAPERPGVYAPVPPVLNGMYGVVRRGNGVIRVGKPGVCDGARARERAREVGAGGGGRGGEASARARAARVRRARRRLRGGAKEAGGPAVEAREGRGGGADAWCGARSGGRRRQSNLRGALASDRAGERAGSALWAGGRPFPHPPPTPCRPRALGASVALGRARVPRVGQAVRLWVEGTPVCGR